MIILGPVAIAKNWVIGSSNDLPWYLPEDLKRFKEVTMGHTVLMGRKSFENIMNRLGKPLPGRKSIVITRNPDYQVPAGVLKFPSIEEALENLKGEDIYFIGGSEIFKAALPLAQKAYVTHLHKDYNGDVFFPEVDFSKWKKISEEPHEEFTFAVYEK
jgi:dihydrofolate reductase